MFSIEFVALLLADASISSSYGAMIVSDALVTHDAQTTA